MKQCTKCNEHKQLSQFGNHKRHKDGKRFRCKACEAADRKEVRKEQAVQNIGELKQYDRASNLKRMYGISIQEWNIKLEQQKGVCAICQGTCVSGRRLSVDHDHRTGKIRELLCGNCNHGLGKFLDSPALLLKAIDYLRKHNDSDDGVINV